MSQTPRIPLLFYRHIKCTPKNKLRPNTESNGGQRKIAVVMLPKINDEKFYNSSWMGNDGILGQSTNDDNDYVTVPDVDIVADEDIYIFDTDDAATNERLALMKMKELWAQVYPDVK